MNTELRKEHSRLLILNTYKQLDPDLPVEDIKDKVIEILADKVIVERELNQDIRWGGNK